MGGNQKSPPFLRKSTSKGRAVRTDTMKRMMQYRDVMGTI